MEEPHKGGKQKQAEKGVGIWDSRPTPTPYWLGGRSLSPTRGGSMAPRLSWRDSACTGLARGEGLATVERLVWGRHGSPAVPAARCWRLQEALSFLQPVLVDETLD